MKNRIYMLKEYTNRQKMGFVIETEQGGYILIDGGYTIEADETLNRIREITGQKVPHLDAIILTHPHADHIGVFNVLIEKHLDEFTFDHVYYCFPSVQYLVRGKEAQEDIDDLTMFYSLLPKFADKAVILTGGDELEICGAQIDVLYTMDSEFTHNVANNASSVFMLTLSGKKILFTGDCGVEAGNKMLRMCPEALKADICQMAHHGQNGVTREFYEKVKPSVCLWCTPLWLWNNDAGKGYNTYLFKTVIVRGWMDEISPNRTDYITKDGEQLIEL